MKKIFWALMFAGLVIVGSSILDHINNPKVITIEINDPELKDHFIKELEKEL